MLGIGNLRLSREFFPVLAPALLIGLAAIVVAPWPAAIPAILLAAVALYFSRDPVRAIPPLPLAVVAPVDGVVTDIVECEDPYLQRQAVRIRVQMGLTDVFTLRSPIEGKVRQQWLGTWSDRGQGGPCGQTHAGWIQTDEEDDVVLVVSHLSWLHRLHCTIQAGERIGQGQRCGFIRFGAPVLVYMPSNSKVQVAVGQRLTAGTDPLAELVHN